MVKKEEHHSHRFASKPNSVMQSVLGTLAKEEPTPAATHRQEQGKYFNPLNQRLSMLRMTGLARATDKPALETPEESPALEQGQSLAREQLYLKNRKQVDRVILQCEKLIIGASVVVSQNDAEE